MFISCANEIKTWNSDSFELLNEHVYFNKTKPINNFVIRPDSKAKPLDLLRILMFLVILFIIKTNKLQV